ncbi:hypothetical protein [Haloglycomyces albus]|uniref:hypothetical protein n=1 Tax=Haloglycomyces albus TaxID=526067 RepID=UPI0012EB5A5A|nr:hypothetical protein [Haloglycomyces albus]
MTMLASLALLLGALSACDNDSDDDATSSTSSEEETTSDMSSPTDGEEDEDDGDEPEEESVNESDAPEVDPSNGIDDGDKSSTMVISGTVEEGVEAGCLVLTHDGTTYGLYGEKDESVVYAGAEVTLSGHVDKGIFGTCQQGTPFVITDAENK